MRLWGLAVATALGCSMIGGVAAAAEVVDADAYFARQGEVVALVRDQDPRFGTVPDYERQETIARQYFDYDRLLGSSYYRVLPTLASTFSPTYYELDYAANWLIEVTLVGGCAVSSSDVGPASDAVPRPDPCEWRHSWFYRVAPDDTVKLLFEEGDPEPMPAG